MRGNSYRLACRWCVAFVLAWCWLHGGLAAAQGTAAIDNPTTRLVSLVPSLTESLFAMGAQDQLVGVSNYCVYPPEAQSRPQVGGLINPALEPILRLRPTDVLLYRSQADTAGKLEELGVRAHLFNVDRLQDVYASWQRLGEITGETSGAARLTQETRTALDAMRERAAGRQIPVLVLVSREPSDLRNLYQAGRENFLGELAELAGGKIAIEGGAPVTREAIIRANPAVIIDLSGGGSAGNAEGEAAARKVWSQLPTVDAVKHGKVFNLGDGHALVPGPNLPQTVRKFEELLGTWHPSGVQR